MVELAVPINFLCPVSLELMMDPVTLSTGQTYDRRSIERWFETGHKSCPSTMQVVDSNDVAPNRTLRRLIRRWCVCHKFGVDVDLPCGQASTWNGADNEQRSTVTATSRQVQQTLRQVALGTDRHNGLKKLRSLAMDSNHQHVNRVVMREAGAIPILTHFAFSPENLSKELLETCEMALGLLTLFLPFQDVSHLVQLDNKQLTAISWFLNRGRLGARVNAAVVLTSLCQDDDEVKLLVGATAGVFEGLVQLLKEDLNSRARDAALKTVLAVISGLARNAARAVEAGVVFAVAELLPEADRRGQDRQLTKVLDELCSCAEGRELVSKHALVVPMLVRIINRRDALTAESAVSCLWTVSQFSSKCLDEAAGQAGILIQLRHFCQADDTKINPETKERAADLLRQLRHRVNHCDDRCQAKLSRTHSPFEQFSFSPLGNHQSASG